MCIRQIHVNLAQQEQQEQQEEQRQASPAPRPRPAAQRSSDAKRSMSEFVPDTMMRSWLVTTVSASA